MATIKKDTCAPEDKTLLEILESIDNFLIEAVFRSKPGVGLVYANNAFIKLFGYACLSEVQALTGYELYADEEERSYLMDKLAATGLILEHPVLCKRKDGTNFWGSLTARKVKRKNQYFYEGRIHDISDQVKVAGQMTVLKNSMERLNGELDRFIYSASHDIRSPIASIQGLINILVLELKDENSKKLTELMTVSINRLKRYVDDLTIFAKNSKTEIKDTQINFRKLVPEILKRFEPPNGSGNIEVSTQFVGDYSFFSDLFRVRLVLHNVIKNTFEFSDKSKSHQVISIQITTHPDKAVIEIFDNGIGIGASHLNSVFDMFYRASSFSKGSGMGLYVAREAIIKMGGTISLDSEYGVGTSVKIDLPNSRKGKLITRKSMIRTTRKSSTI